SEWAQNLHFKALETDFCFSNFIAKNAFFIFGFIWIWVILNEVGQNLSDFSAFACEFLNVYIVVP
ncbi:unnamed protein product, partial [Larinioides sclopetarius]